MSRLEKIFWEISRIQMKVKGSINIPELVGPSVSVTDSDPLTHLGQEEEEEDCIGLFSPTPSVDSGRSTCSVMTPSPKYLIHGGPGFSLGLLDSTTGTTKHLPIPVLVPSSVDSSICDNFSLSEVLSASFAGDAQIWVGTEAGSLHAFDLTAEMRLSSHAYTKLPDPVTCITTGQPSLREDSLPAVNGSLLRGVRNKAEVLVGSSNGNLTIIVGEANERGGLRNPLKCPRKVIQLGDFEAGGSMLISSIAPVSSSWGDAYWCGCGSKIVILQRSNWREVDRLNGCAGLSALSEDLSQEVYISQLLATEVGVWSSISHSSTVVLWDSESHCAKLNITCHNHCTTLGTLVDDFAKITALNFSDPLLFVGTRGGHLLSFKIEEDLTASPSRSSTALLTHRIAAATYCSEGGAIISIHSAPVSSSLCPSPLPSTPVPTMHVLVVLGELDSKENTSPSSAAGCRAEIYELSSSPRPSPLTSPLPCTAGVCCEQSSPPTSSLTNTRNSLTTSLPKLSLVGVAKGSRSFLPLQDSD